MKQWIVAMAMAVGLAACSSGPSNRDLQAALERHVKDNGWDDAAVHDLKSGKCVASGSTAGYSCAVEFRAVANGGRFNETMGGTFVFDKVGGDWRVVGVAGL